MKVLVADKEQYENLNGFTNGNSQLNFVKDADGNYIVGIEVLIDPCFDDIKEQLGLLNKIVI